MDEGYKKNANKVNTRSDNGRFYQLLSGHFNLRGASTYYTRCATTHTFLLKCTYYYCVVL